MCEQIRFSLKHDTLAMSLIVQLIYLIIFWLKKREQNLNTSMQIIILPWTIEIQYLLLSTER